MPPSDVDQRIWRQHAWRNRLQSVALLVVMLGFLSLLGALLWGAQGVIMLLLAGLIGIVFNQSLSPWLVINLYGAKPVAPAEAPVVHTLLSRLALRADLPRTPVLFYVPSRMLNAFAVGTPGESVIIVTDGLLRQLGLRELAGVLAHEISHIRHRDLWVMGLADMFSRTTSLLSLLGQFMLLLNLPLILFSEVVINWFAIALLIFAPTLSALAQLALSRTREYDADLNAARLTGDPDGLARALARIEQVQGGWLERLFMPGRRIPEPSLLRTHPETGERIARLMALKPRMTGLHAPLFADMTHNPGGHVVERPPGWHINGLWF